MMNIHKIGELWGLPRATLRSLFGEGGEDLYLQSRGIDSRPLVTRALPKSVSRETTFLEDLWDRQMLLAHLAYLCDRLTLGLREDRLYAHVIEVKARYSDFRTEIQRRLVLTPLQEMGEDLQDRRGAVPGALRAARGWPCGWSGSRPRTSSGRGPCRSSSRTRNAPSSWAGPSTGSGRSTGSGPCSRPARRCSTSIYAFEPRRGYVLKTASLTK